MYGVRKHLDHLVQVQNSSSFQFSVSKTRIALQMWRRKTFPRPLHIVVAPKQHHPEREIVTTVVDYSFYDRGDYFEYIIWIDENKFLAYDRATQHELAASIQKTVSTMLFPERDQAYLEMEL